MVDKNNNIQRSKQNDNRNIEWINSLRAISCLAVIMIHVIDGWPSMSGCYNFSNLRCLFDNLLIQPFIRVAVPIFIMISGCLLLNPDKDVNIKKIKKYIIKMIYILMIFGLLYCAIEIVVNKNYTNYFEIIYKSIFNLFQEKSWGHMWYIYMLIGLYIMTPLLKIYIEHADIHTQKFLLVTLFIITLLIPTINDIYNIELTTFKLSYFKYIYIYMLGYYIVYTDLIKKRFLIFSGIIGLLGFLICIYFFNYHSQTNIFIVMLSAYILYLFSRNKIKIKNNIIINSISKYSLGIYVLHTFWLNIFYKGLKITPDFLPIIIGEVFFLIITLILSMISSFLLYKFPITKRCFK